METIIRHRWPLGQKLINKDTGEERMVTAVGRDRILGDLYQLDTPTGHTVSARFQVAPAHRMFTEVPAVKHVIFVFGDGAAVFGFSGDNARRATAKITTFTDGTVDIQYSETALLDQADSDDR